MKKRILALLSIVTLAMVIFAGCKEKTALTPDQFKSKMEEQGYEVQDATDQFMEGSGVQKVYIALKDNHQIEFYQVENEDQAIEAFGVNKSNFESSKDNSSVETDVSGKNGSKYTLRTGGKYMAVSRIDNTFVYLVVEETVKDEVDEVLKELGY